MFAYNITYIDMLLYIVVGLPRRKAELNSEGVEQSQFILSCNVLRAAKWVGSASYL